MKENSNRCCDAQLHINEVCGRNQNSINDVVSSIADQDEVACRMDMTLTFQRVTVTPVDKLFDDEGEEDSPENDEECISNFCTAPNDFRKQVQEDIPKQCTRRETYEI